MRLALEVALEAKRLDVIFVELALGNIAVIALDLLLGLELGAEVGRLALAALAMLARPIFTLVVGAAGSAPDVLAHPAIDLVFRFCALRHRGSSCSRFQVQRGTRPPLRLKERRQAFSRARRKSHGCVKQQARSRLPESAPEARPPKWLRLGCQTFSGTAGRGLLATAAKQSGLDRLLQSRTARHAGVVCFKSITLRQLSPKWLIFSAFKCLICFQAASHRGIVMQFSHLFVRRTIDFRGAPI